MKICGHTGISVGSENCKLCVNHSCEGYKTATKKSRKGAKTMTNVPIANDLYIDYELSREKNPYNTPPDLNRLVDKGVVRHLICNINPPDGYSHEDLYNHPIMVRILDEFDKMPMWSLTDIYKEMANEQAINDVLEYARHDDTVIMHFWQSGGGNRAIGHVDSMDTPAPNSNGMPAYVTIGGIGSTETRGGK